MARDKCHIAIQREEEADESFHREARKLSGEQVDSSADRSEIFAGLSLSKMRSRAIGLLMRQVRLGHQSSAFDSPMLQRHSPLLATKSLALEFHFEASLRLLQSASASLSRDFTRSISDLCVALPVERETHDVAHLFRELAQIISRRGHEAQFLGFPRPTSTISLLIYPFKNGELSAPPSSCAAACFRTPETGQRR